MIPCILYPHAEAIFHYRKIDNTAYRVQEIGAAGKRNPVIVAVQISAFALMPDYAMTAGNIVIP